MIRLMLYLIAIPSGLLMLFVGFYTLWDLVS